MYLTGTESVVVYVALQGICRVFPWQFWIPNCNREVTRLYENCTLLLFSCFIFAVYMKTLE